jgi:hypothetical protein
MRKEALGFGLGAALACGGNGGADGGSASMTSIGSLTSAQTDTSVDTTADDDDDTGESAGPDSDPATPGIMLKFDVAPPDIVVEPPEDEGCSKVDFMFVIDNSNSMATNQGELVASFPEFVSAIEGTLTDVESFHVGVVTSDSYDFNENGCTMIGAVVTETGGVNSSNSVCTPFVEGFRYMTDQDDLPTAFACAALIGTAGDNDERMMEGATEALSPALNAAGACNDGFIRDDALLVTVLISDEDDPGSSLVGSPGDPMSWYDEFIAVKTFPENIVVLTLTRGSPGNACGFPQGSEVDGAQLMEFASMFGANGFFGDICANSFGPFFEEAVGVIESACENFMPPEG